MSETIAVNGAFKLEVAEGTAVSRHRIVTVGANARAAECGATADACGISQNEMPAAAADRPHSGNIISVLPMNFCGKIRLIASAAISVDDQLEKAADGKVATYSAGHKIGWNAITSAAADGDEIEAIPAVYDGL